MGEWVRADLELKFGHWWSYAKLRVNSRCHHGWWWEAMFSKLLATQDNLFLLFYLSIDGNINRLESSDSFFVLFTVIICFDSIFNLLKRITKGSFLFLCKKLVFFFLTFLNLGTQIRCRQNRYTDLKSALDHSLGGWNLGQTGQKPGPELGFLPFSQVWFISFPGNCIGWYSWNNA